MITYFPFAALIPAASGCTVATHRRPYNSCVQVTSNLDRAIGAPVIGYDNFSGDAVFLQEKLRLLNASCQGASLVKAGHHNGYLWFDRADIRN